MMILRASSRTLALLAFLVLQAFHAAGYAQTVEQSRVEAAMTLRLLSFAAWPDGDIEQEKTPIRIGVFENQALLEEFASLLQHESNQDRFVIRLISDDASDEGLSQLDAVVFGQALTRETARMLRRIEGRPILLIGSFDGFLEHGGMVNYTRVQRRLGFEINIRNARAVGIEFRAKLLRLASRVIE